MPPSNPSIYHHIIYENTTCVYVFARRHDYLCTRLWSNTQTRVHGKVTIDAIIDPISIIVIPNQSPRLSADNKCALHSVNNEITILREKTKAFCRCRVSHPLRARPFAEFGSNFNACCYGCFYCYLCFVCEVSKILRQCTIYLVSPRLRT